MKFQGGRREPSSELPGSEVEDRARQEDVALRRHLAEAGLGEGGFGVEELGQGGEAFDLASEWPPARENTATVRFAL